MKNIYSLRNEFTLREYNTAITRENFETFFTKTKEKVTFTFGGWDVKVKNRKNFFPLATADRRNSQAPLGGVYCITNSQHFLNWICPHTPYSPQKTFP